MPIPAFAIAQCATCRQCWYEDATNEMWHLDEHVSLLIFNQKTEANEKKESVCEGKCQKWKCAKWENGKQENRKQGHVYRRHTTHLKWALLVDCGASGAEATTLLLINSCEARSHAILCQAGTHPIISSCVYDISYSKAKPIKQQQQGAKEKIFQLWNL